MNYKELYRHRLTNNVGVFVKEYYPTGRPLTMQIKLNDGRIYYAPKHEFDFVGFTQENSMQKDEEIFRERLNKNVSRL